MGEGLLRLESLADRLESDVSRLQAQWDHIGEAFVESVHMRPRSAADRREKATAGSHPVLRCHGHEGEGTRRLPESTVSCVYRNYDDLMPF
jgi:hypothetical protein